MKILLSTLFLTIPFLAYSQTPDTAAVRVEIDRLILLNDSLVKESKLDEGVYGLQRAFKIAGAKYLIMSLWQVPDRQTKDFMVTFYRHLLEEEMTIPDAFRITQLEMKERFYDPHLWAGFVLVE